MNRINKWCLLPGMGADSSMYTMLRAELSFDVLYIDWPKYNGEKTYAAVANRIIKENDIMDGDIVGGSSLGGMIALEIARRKKLRAVVLIGSAVKSEEIQGILTLLSPIAAITPIAFIQLLVGKNNSMISKMFAEADPDFIRAMCRYLQKWPGGVTDSTPVYRIHGQKDHVISCPKSGCVIIENAGHLPVITHPRKCAVFLNKVAADCADHSGDPVDSVMLKRHRR